MSLRLKINLIVSALTLLFMAAVIGLQLRSQRDSVYEETSAANRVASQLLSRTAWLHAAQGTPAMLAFLQGVGRIRSNDITLFDNQGHELYRSPPSQYKAGRDAPAWFARMVTPTPTEQAIQFPDGKLVVRSNASRAAIDSWDYMGSLAASALVLLGALNALVFWLVGSAMRPLARIAGALGQLEAGRFDVQLPRLPGREAAAIGTAFNRMVGQLQQHIETERRAVRAEMELSDSRELTRWIDQHVEAERLMIARELHDEFGQSVTAMRSMALSVAQRTVATDPASAQAAQLIAEEASRLYDAMHGIIPRLTPLVLDSFGLAEALADLAQRTRRSHAGVRIETQVALGQAQLQPDLSLALYRAAQEGITNALRHGEATLLELRVMADSARVELELLDDGRGLPPGGIERSGHHGLRWLTERAEGLGGVFRLEPRTPRGARLSLSLPLGAALPMENE